jgi:D-3-phosphoglycerate dehydrogenase
MAKILITDGIENSAAAELKKLGHEIIEKHYPPEELIDQIKYCDAIIVRSATRITKEIIDGALSTKRLKLIIRGGVGVDNIDVPYAAANGIDVLNTPGASSQAVAELTVGHMFALARHIYISNVSMRKGLWNKKMYSGIELSGKTLGLVGFGRIARNVAQISKALGMNVLYYDIIGPVKNILYQSCQYVPLEELLRRSDFISVHVPFDKKAGALISTKEFDLMKNGVYLINCARGGVICEDALLAALDSGKVAAAALDVFETEPLMNERIYSHERISLTPHIGASTAEAQERIGDEIVEIIRSRF